MPEFTINEYFTFLHKQTLSVSFCLDEKMGGCWKYGLFTPHSPYV